MGQGIRDSVSSKNHIGVPVIRRFFKVLMEEPTIKEYERSAILRLTLFKRHPRTPFSCLLLLLFRKLFYSTR